MSTEQQHTDRPYIVRRGPYQGNPRVMHLIGTDLWVGRVEQLRATGRNIGGMFREVESTGKNVAGVLRFRLTGLDGRGMKRDHGMQLRANPVEVKKNVRRVRPEELVLLAKHDARIAELEEQLKAARTARAATAAEVWVKAHVVTVKELEALVEAAEAVTKQRTSYGMDEETRQQVAAAHAEVRALFARS